MNEIISLFIDDEMELDEKIDFVEAVQNNPSFADETIELLSIEKQIRADVVERVPLIEPVRPGILNKLSGFFREPLGWTATALAAALIALILTTLPSSEPVSRQSRFVIYKPEVSRVEIAGSFTNWKRIPLYRDGDSGYWELTLALPEGEHHFSYILEGRQRIADPTIRTREPDDFGGYNSILYVGGEA
jgi:hypothetical protein